MKYINRFLLLLLPAVTILTSLVLVAPSRIYADAKSDACAGIGAVNGTNGCQSPAGSPQPEKIVATIVNILSVVVGVIAVIMIIIAGFKFVTSGGDSTAVSSARNTIIYAAVGLIIVALAQIIVHFVLNRISG